MTKESNYTFIVPCIWELVGTQRVSSSTLQGASEVAEAIEGLPNNGEYISGSYQVDEEGLELKYPTCNCCGQPTTRPESRSLPDEPPAAQICVHCKHLYCLDCIDIYPICRICKSRGGTKE